MNAPRSIDEYLRQLREALRDEDPALIQDALYDAEEYLRAEVTAHPGKSEADVLELIASTYGAPEEVAAAYRETEIKVRAALKSPAPRTPANPSALARFFGVYLDPRTYSSLFYMLLSLALGIAYFTFVVLGLSLSAGFAILVIGIPFFLAFIGIARVIALGEGRLLEAVTGERMPRRPIHPGPAAHWWQRILEMVKDVRTWTTLAYLLVMLPLGITYFTVAVCGLSIGMACIAAPLALLGQRLGLFGATFGSDITLVGSSVFWSAHQGLAGIALLVVGVIVLTSLMHLARATIRGHARLAKFLLAVPAG